MSRIFPSILSSNFFDLQKKLDDFSEAGIEFIHLDVMDGHFVTNLSFGPSMSKAIKDNYSFKVDTHLMVTNPSDCIKWFAEADSDWISFHIEASADVKSDIELIRSYGKGAGLVLNPDTDIREVFRYLPLLDYVLIMSVFPGYGGQSFIEQTYERIALLKEEIVKNNYKCMIQVEGGINTSLIKKISSAGADLFVIGTHLYNSESIKARYTQILNELRG